MLDIIITKIVPCVEIPILLQIKLGNNENKSKYKYLL